MVLHRLCCGMTLRWLFPLLLRCAGSVGCGGLFGRKRWACCGVACGGRSVMRVFSSGDAVHWGRFFCVGMAWGFIPLALGNVVAERLPRVYVVCGICFCCGPSLWRGVMGRAPWRRRWPRGKRESGKTVCVLPDSTEIIVSLENRHLTLSARLTAFPRIRVPMLSNIFNNLKLPTD